MTWSRAVIEVFVIALAIWGAFDLMIRLAP